MAALDFDKIKSVMQGIISAGEGLEIDASVAALARTLTTEEAKLVKQSLVGTQKIDFEQVRSRGRVSTGRARTDDTIRIMDRKAAIDADKAVRVARETSEAAQTAQLRSNATLAAKRVTEGQAPIRVLGQALRRLRVVDPAKAAEIEIEFEGFKPKKEVRLRDPMSVRRARRVGHILESRGVSPSARVSGIPGVGQTIEQSLATDLPFKTKPGERTTSRRAIPGRKAIGSAVNRGGVAKVAGGGLLLTLLASKIFGGSKKEGSQLPPELQMALAQQVGASQQGGGGGVNTSRTLMDMARLVNLIKSLRSMNTVQGMAQPQRMI